MLEAGYSCGVFGNFRPTRRYADIKIRFAFNRSWEREDHQPSPLERASVGGHDRNVLLSTVGSISHRNRGGDVIQLGDPKFLAGLGFESAEAAVCCGSDKY